MTEPRVRVVILEDHLGIIDGYRYRLNQDPEIQVVGTAMYGEDLEFLLAEQPADVLLMDISVPVSPQNHTSFPIINVIPKLLKKHPRLHILIISRLNQPVLTKTLIEKGISGYILKRDPNAIQQLAKIVSKTARGGLYFSPGVDPQQDEQPETGGSSVPILTIRQKEALSLCAAYPDKSTDTLAVEMGVVSTTLRNLLSGAYDRLEVHTRAAAILRAQQLGLLISTQTDETQDEEE